MLSRSVWITGIGAATPLGFDFETIGQRLLAGESAARVVVDQNSDRELRSPGCLIDSYPVPAGWSEAEFHNLDRIDQSTIWSCSSALRDSGWVDTTGQTRVGLILGVGIEWIRYWQAAVLAGDLSPYAGKEPAGLVDRTQQQLQLTGPTTTIAAACASANYALALGRQWIRRGMVDVCLAGGVESVSGLGRAAFHNLRALSRRADEPLRASRPFDRDRDGFVMSEGSVIMLLESDEHAQRRGARAYGEVAGFGATSDAFHMIIPSLDAVSVAAAMQQALADAKIEPSDVDYVNAHATSTPVGDVAESRAMHRVFGSRVHSTPVSSTKGTTGHLLSAAAAMEALAGLVAIRHQSIPPTINLDHPDPECDLCHVAHQAQPAPVNVVLSNSFGFGGNNTSLVLRKVA